MSPDVLIVGQGLAGTLLAWELERAGVSFAIADAGEPGASHVAAGIINPVTGRRLVKSWRVDELLPLARATYTALGDALGVRIWHPMRMRRLFAGDDERASFAAKQARNELAPFAGAADEEGFWIADAARVDLRQLLDAARERWRAQGRLQERVVAMNEEVKRYTMVIDCRGAAGAKGGKFAFVPWEFSKGETIEVAIEGLRPDVILNRRHWILPVNPGKAWVGATHEPGRSDATVTSAAREALAASAREIWGQSVEVTGQRAGVRINLPDKRPVVGRHPECPNLGVMNGLGAKGALVAPWLARMWMEQLRNGAAFDAEVEVGRFWRRGGTCCARAT